MMIHRDIDEVSPGTVLASDVFGASGHVLIAAGAVLTPQRLRALKAQGVAQITVQTPPLTLPSNIAITPTEPHILEIFRHSNAQHPLIKELIRLCELRTGRPLHKHCQHGH